MNKLWTTADGGRTGGLTEPTTEAAGHSQLRRSSSKREIRPSPTGEGVPPALYPSPPNPRCPPKPLALASLPRPGGELSFGSSAIPEIAAETYVAKTRKTTTERPKAPAKAPAATLPVSTSTVWDRYQLASHKDRPHTADYIRELFTDFVELAGDRNFRDDPAVIAGFARFEEKPVVVLGQEMGKEAKERHRRNYGMMHPEGYRKALRLMNLGDRFNMPVFCLVDTKGAYPGTGAEERGQAEAIARNIRDMYKLRVPVIVTIIGAGASGGALGIGLGDRVLMMENSWYNVISPEGCAAILWNDPAMAPVAAEKLGLMAADVHKLGVVDEIVSEPNGGAHVDQAASYQSLRLAFRRNLAELSALTLEKLLEARREKYRKMGVYREV